MLSNLTADEISIVVSSFGAALDIKRDTQSIHETRMAVHKLVESAHQAGRLADTDLSCIIDLVLAYNWLEDAARAGPIVLLVNEIYKHRPYTGDRLSQFKTQCLH